MEAPTFSICRSPRRLEKYLTKMAKAITKTSTLTGYQAGDAVLVLEDGVKYPGVIAEVFPDDDGEPTTYDVDFSDGIAGTYDAGDFC